MCQHQADYVCQNYVLSLVIFLRAADVYQLLFVGHFDNAFQLKWTQR